MTDLEDAVARNPKLSEHTRRGYIRAVREFLDYAGRDPRRWTGPIAEAFRDEVAKRVTPQTANYYVRGLKHASKWCARRTGVLDFAAYVQPLPEIEEKKRRALDPERARRLVLACEGPRPIDVRDLALVVFGLRTGLRRAEIAQLTFEKLNLQDRQVKGILIKGRRRHSFSIDAETAEALAPWLGWLGSQKIRTGPVFRALSRPRIDGSISIGDGLTTAGIYDVVKSRARKVGLRGVHPHIFRHTFISWGLDQGLSPRDIRRATGQKTDDIIERYDTHREIEETAPVGSHLPSLRRNR